MLPETYNKQKEAHASQITGLLQYILFKGQQKTENRFKSTAPGFASGVPGEIRTRGLPLRSAKKRSPLMPFGTPGVPYFTGFLTFLSVRISLQNTPVFPG